MQGMSELVAKAVEMVKAERYAEAMSLFEQDATFTRSPAALSYYALCLVHTEGNFERAAALCLIASEREFYNPDIYFNLGNIFLMRNQKKSAMKTFRKGLKLDNSHGGIISAIKKLGARRRPIFFFLPRHNAVNKILGRLAKRLNCSALFQGRQSRIYGQPRS